MCVVRETNSQRSVFECRYKGLLIRTEEILIEQQIIILPGFFSAERYPVGIVLFFLLFLCIHTQTHTELCFLCSYLPPNLDPIFDF